MKSSCSQKVNEDCILQTAAQNKLETWRQKVYKNERTLTLKDVVTWASYSSFLKKKNGANYYKFLFIL